MRWPFMLRSTHDRIVRRLHMEFCERFTETAVACAFAIDKTIKDFQPPKNEAKGGDKP